MIRIAWNINEKWGNGDWHPLTGKPMLQAHVDDCNSRHGPHTHWLEQSATAEDSSVTELTEVVK